MHVAPRIFPSSGLLVYTKRAHLLLLIFTGRCYIILLGQPERFTSKRQLRTTSPVNTNSSAGENGFRRKTGRSRPFIHQSGQTTEISVLSQAIIRFFRPMARNGSFWLFFGPKWRFHFLMLAQKDRIAGRAKCTQVTLFPYNCWVYWAKTWFGPVWGVPGPKRVLGNGRRPLGETALFMQKSRKLQE